MAEKTKPLDEKDIELSIYREDWGTVTIGKISSALAGAKNEIHGRNADMIISDDAISIYEKWFRAVLEKEVQQ